ncbi:Uncharacterized protein TCM_017545 [Theobroma cacao]|uniref:Uncharacterized protein n=1 Tax=Theobroma cacao TaxID=3641 RepID=A0A061EDN6_THECC|nr:Uncharacterized protein TCM_017545 [Theobroma cacao]
MSDDDNAKLPDPRCLFICTCTIKVVSHTSAQPTIWLSTYMVKYTYLMALTSTLAHKLLKRTAYHGYITTYGSYLKP